MPKTTAALLRIFALTAALCALRAGADVVVTTNGARIVGKISTIQSGVITIDTDYAGTLKVKQSLTASVETDHPVAVRMADGTRIVGTVSESPDGRLKISGSQGDTYTTIDHVAASWAATEEDPDVVARRKKWGYELGVDIAGESGNQTQLGTAMDFKADRKGPSDELQLYTAYNRQVTNGEKSVDQGKAGVDYSDNFSDATSWYLRDEAGFDRVMDITFDDVAATGLGYDLIKLKAETLTARAGVSYRYDQYATGSDTENVSALGGDLEAQYSLAVGKSLLTDKIAYLPEFQDFSNYIITHEFAFQIPITKSLWKLSLGVSNSYNSKPVSGLDKLETIYFTRLVLTWGQPQVP